MHFIVSPPYEFSNQIPIYLSWEHMVYTNPPIKHNHYTMNMQKISPEILLHKWFLHGEVWASKSNLVKSEIELIARDFKFKSDKIELNLETPGLWFGRQINGLWNIIAKQVAWKDVVNIIFAKPLLLRYFENAFWMFAVPLSLDCW